jgi:hypothetical protein
MQSTGDISDKNTEANEYPSSTPDIVKELARAGDYGFEMRIGRDLRGVPGADVRHGQSYHDDRTGKQRAFDYQFSYGHDCRRIQLAIECKNVNRASPIVVCGQERVRHESYHDIVCAASGVLRDRTEYVTVENGLVSQVFRLDSSTLYPIHDPAQRFVGKSVFRPKPPKDRNKGRHLPLGGFTVVGDDDGYDAWNQAVGSAADMAIRSLLFEHRQGQGILSATVTLPLMVVPDGTLWRVEFGEAGEPVADPVPVEDVTYFCDHRARRADKIGTVHYREVRLPHVHFFTQLGLQRFLKVLQNRFAIFWDNTFPEEKISDFKARLSSG